MKARHLRWARLGALGLLALAGCTPQPKVATSQAQLPPVEPGMARVWFFRQSDPTGGNVYAADPIVYANGAPVGQIAAGDRVFSQFPARKVQVYGAALWNPHSRARHPAASAGDAGLRAGSMGSQLGSEPHRRGQQLYRPDLLARGGAAVSPDADQSRPTLIPDKPGCAGPVSLLTRSIRDWAAMAAAADRRSRCRPEPRRDR